MHSLLRVLQMLSWMIGVLLGLLCVQALPVLPDQSAVLWTPLFAVLLLFYRRKFPLTILLLVGFSSGLLWAVYQGHGLLERRPSADCDNRLVDVSGVVSSLPSVATLSADRQRQRFELLVTAIEPSTCAGPRRVLVSYYGDHSIAPGQGWRFEIRLKQPWGLANPGAYNMEAWFSANGIDAIGNVRSRSAVLLHNAGGAGFLHHRIRQEIRQKIDRLAITDDARGIILALAIADRSGIDTELELLFRHFGISHLLVISGLHIGLLAALGYGIGTTVARIFMLFGCHSAGRHCAAFLAGFFALCYAALAGFSIPTQRALLMLSVFLLASLFDREVGNWRNLLKAGLCVLILNPLAGISSSFWLSFGAVAWLTWFSAWQRPGGVLAQAGRLHLWMSLVMVPASAWWFAGASLVAGIANFVVVPIMAVFIVPLTLLAVLLHYIFNDIGAAILTLIAVLLDYMVVVGRGLAELIDRDIYASITVWGSTAALAIVALALLVTRPGRWQFILATLMLIPVLLPPERWQGDDSLIAKITFLDVSQGTAVIVEDGTRVLLYDTGGGDPAGSNMANSVILPYLATSGAKQLDTLIVSHSDNDHSAGAATLLERFRAAEFRYGGADIWPVGRSCRVGEAWRWASGIQFQVLASDALPSVVSNNTSCVLKITIADHVFLLPGDIDQRRERELVTYWQADLRAEFLLAAHHGSNSSSAWVWLKYVQPKSVVFSHGYASAFGHPHPKVVERFSKLGVTAHSTGHGGALQIHIRSDSNTATQGYRAAKRRYWHSRVSVADAGEVILQPSLIHAGN